jgi:hypothetical protein
VGWTYSEEDLKTKQDYINLLEEIESYRSLDGKDFDFGTGTIVNDMSYGSEDAYYEMDIQTLEEIIKWWEYDNKPKIKHKLRYKPSRYYLKEKERKRLNYLSKVSWHLVIERDDFKQRCYLGKRSAYLKKKSNKKVRKYNRGLPIKGNTYRKIFDYWWEMF